MYTKIPELRFLTWHRFISNVTSEFRLDNKLGHSSDHHGKIQTCDHEMSTDPEP